MSKTSATTTTKLTGRSDYQVAMANQYMADLVTASTASTVTFNTDPTTLAGAVDKAIKEAKAAGQAGHSQALHSLRRVLGAWGMRNSSKATAADKAQAAKVVTNLPAANVADAKEANLAKRDAQVAKNRAAKEAEGPKAGRQAAPAKAAPQGYVPTVHLTVAFDVFRATDGSGYLVRCNQHGATTTATSTGTAIAAGRAAQRASWCKGCGTAAKAPKATKAPTPEQVATKAAPAGKLAPRTRRQRREAANLPVFDGLVQGLATGDMGALETAVKATKAGARKGTARQQAAAKRAAAKASK